MCYASVKARNSEELTKIFQVPIFYLQVIMYKFTKETRNIL